MKDIWIVRIVNRDEVARTLNELEREYSPASPPILTAVSGERIMISWRIVNRDIVVE